MTSTHSAAENNPSNCKTEAPLGGNYFVSAYPPFSCWTRESATDVLHRLERLDSSHEDTPLGLYVHIPFCTVRCLFCYYLSYAKKSSEVIERYVQALIKELSLYYELIDLSTRSVKFAYFGGGTPSILSASQISTLIGGLKKILPWTAAEEITFECSPKSVDQEKLLALRDVGVTRISMGVQQLDDEVLRKNGRVHLVSDVEQAYEMFQRIIKRPNGVFLVTGPTGSGKTTTLYAALQELNRPDRKIITAEDPVEYNFPGMNQCQVRDDIGLTFAIILRAMLRQSPNIILVGEIRDKEVGEVAIQAALTGHLVFSTLHTNDAPSAITRLIDMGIKPFLVASAVQAIMAQRLIRLICKECRVEDPDVSPYVLRVLGFSDGELDGKPLWKGAGCKRCGGE